MRPAAFPSAEVPGLPNLGATPLHTLHQYNASVILMLMDIVFLNQARKELERTPQAIVQDVISLLEELAKGRSLGMPISRPLPSIAKGLHELRLSDRAGEFRVFYVIRVGDAIYILHVAHKKSRTASAQTVALVKARLKEIES